MFFVIITAFPLWKWEKLWRQITTWALFGPEKIYVSVLSFKAGCCDCHCYWYPRFLSNFSLDSCQINHNTVGTKELDFADTGHRYRCWRKCYVKKFLKASLVLMWQEGLYSVTGDILYQRLRRRLTSGATLDLRRLISERMWGLS